MLTTTNTIVNQAFATEQSAGRRQRIRLPNKAVESCSSNEILNSLVSAPISAMGMQANRVTETELRKMDQQSSETDDSQDEIDMDVSVHQSNGMAPTSKFIHRKRPNASKIPAITVCEATESRYLLRINVGGASFVLLSRYVIRYGPTTLLGRMAAANHEQRLRMCHIYLEKTDEYFFHRAPDMFPPIFGFYTSGFVHVPDNVCLRNFLVEMKYWQIPYDKIACCCSPIIQDEENDEIEEDPEDEAQPFEGKVCSKLRLHIWRITEGASGGHAWQIYEFFSSTFVMLSICGLILSTLPSLQIDQAKTSVANPSQNVINNGTNSSNIINSTAPPITPYPPQHPYYPHHISPAMRARLCHPPYRFGSLVATPSSNSDSKVEHPFFTYLEYVCVAYFALDYLIRFLVAPDKKSFAITPLNLIDLIVIAPCLLELVFDWSGLNNESFRQVRWTIVTVRVLRVLRVLRIAKLGRFSSGLRSFALTMNKSKQHLQMVAVIMITGVVFFSTTVYFLEKDIEDTEFTSIPASFWWCVVTMTTVGYGDAVPATPAGKMVASATIVSGMMVLALPITITVNNFMQVTRMNASSIHTLAAEHGQNQGGNDNNQNDSQNASFNKRSFLMPNGGSSFTSSNPV